MQSGKAGRVHAGEEGSAAAACLCELLPVAAVALWEHQVLHACSRHGRRLLLNPPPPPRRLHSSSWGAGRRLAQPAVTAGATTRAAAGLRDVEQGCAGPACVRLQARCGNTAPTGKTPTVASDRAVLCYEVFPTAHLSAEPRESSPSHPQWAAPCQSGSPRLQGQNGGVAQDRGAGDSKLSAVQSCSPSTGGVLSAASSSKRY